MEQEPSILPQENKSTSELHYDVDYNALDYLKRYAGEKSKPTTIHLRRTGYRDVSESHGQSARVVEGFDHYLASTIEGLGTKDLVTKSMETLTHQPEYYYAIAQDTVATIINDLVSVGATPIWINAFWAGAPDWFETARGEALINGWTDTCDKIGVAYLGGETQALKDKIAPGTIVLAGSATGKIEPKERYISGEKLQAGDAILLVESNGIQTNGLTLARDLAAILPEGYMTKISDNGKTFGDALLSPSHIYAPLVLDLLDQGINLHYLSHITGHGWRKLMRANKDLSYIIDMLPPVQPEFAFIQQHANQTDKQMYETFNMGAGFAIFAPQEEVEQIIQTGQNHGLKIYNAGHVEDGPKQVIIKPKNIVFPEESLALS